MKPVRILYITEAQGLHKTLLDYLESDFRSVVLAESYIEGLGELQRTSYDVIIISCDITDNYSMQDAVKIIQEANEHQVILVTEQEKSISCQIHETSVFLNLRSKLALEQVQKIVKKAEDQHKRDSMKIDTTAETSLLDSIPVGLYRIQPNGDFLECSRVLVALFGSPNIEAVLGENYFSMFYDPEDERTWKEIMTRDYELRGFVYSIVQHSGETIWVRDTARAVFSSSGEVSCYVGSLEDVTRQKHFDNSLSFLKTHDVLTGLPNKSFFLDQARLTISQARYSGDVIAYLTIDLAEAETRTRVNTKIINAVIQQAAQRIKKSLRKSDHIARIEERSFIVMLHSLRSRKDILTVAEKLTYVFSSPFLVESSRIDMYASIGISVHPDHGDEIETLLNRSKIAALTARDREQQGGYMMYRDTIQHRNGVHDS